MSCPLTRLSPPAAGVPKFLPLATFLVQTLIVPLCVSPEKWTCESVRPPDTHKGGAKGPERVGGIRLQGMTENKLPDTPLRVRLW
jgi:hypothetical protein